MATAVIVLRVLGGLIVLAGLIVACLPSAAVRDLASRFFRKRR